MADYMTTKDALLDAISQLAASAVAATSSERAEHLASAAQHLAEAHAWLQDPNQPH